MNRIPLTTDTPYFGDVFREYWDNTHQVKSDSERQRAREYGFELPEEEQPLELRVAQVAEAAIDWASIEAPGLLAASEVSVLKNLVASGG